MKSSLPPDQPPPHPACALRKLRVSRQRHRGSALPGSGGVHSRLTLASHWTWLAIGFVVAFATPFLLTDVLDLNRDVFYGVYALVVATLFAGWARSTGYAVAAAVTVGGIRVPVLLIASRRAGELKTDRVYQARISGHATLWHIPDAERTKGLQRHPAEYQAHLGTFLAAATRP
jgi:hypothetical protein